MLANRAVAGMLGWAEDFITEVNGPALILCGVVAVIALMSGGALFASWSWLLVAWPAAQAVGVDIMVLVAVRYAVRFLRRMFDEARAGHGGAAVCYAFLGAFWSGVVAMLSSVIYTANRVFGYQLMTGASEDHALSHFGITPDAFIEQRSLVLVGLIVLSAIVLALKQQQGAAEVAANVAERAATVPLHERPTVRTPATPRASQRVAVSAPAYAMRRTDQQLVTLEPTWNDLAAQFCMENPSAGGKTLRKYLVQQLGEDDAPSHSKCQELAKIHRPPVLKLAAPRPAMV